MPALVTSKRLSLLALLLASCGSVTEIPIVPDAAVCQMQCGSYAECNPSSDTCECVAGYTKSGEECVFTGIVVEPEFEGTAWSTTGDAFLGESRDSHGRGGILPQSAVCDGDSVYQDIVMPPRDNSQQFVLEVTHWDQWVYEFPLSKQIPIGVSFGGIIQPLASTDVVANQPETVRICLGDSAYGGSKRLEFIPNPYSYAGCAGDDVQTAILSADIVLANDGECPEPGQAKNGDAEGDDGWTFDSGQGVVEYVQSEGYQNSRAVKLSMNCDDGRATTSLSIGQDVAHPALRLWYKTSGQHESELWFGNYGADTQFTVGLPDAPSGAFYTACIPKGLAGYTTGVAAAMRFPEGCTTIPTRTLIIDELSVVDDARCAGDLLDASFEQSNSPEFGAWNLIGSELVEDANAANDGLVYARLSISQQKQRSRVNAGVYLPREVVGASAITFSHLTQDHLTFSDIRVQAGFRGMAIETLPLENDWRTSTFCAPPIYSGWPAIIEANIYQTGTSHVYEGRFDKFQLGLVPDCQ